MKRSHEVVLWMLGTLGFTAMYSEEKTIEQLKQDYYTSKADCVQDWGDEENCKEDTKPTYTSGGGGGGGGGGRYNGPRYYWDRSEGHPVIVTDSGKHQPIPTAHPGGNALSHSVSSLNAGSVTRGGFGHFSFRSGGG
jgi:uncharacterized protein YgiB involved in biofilm formation